MNAARSLFPLRLLLLLLLLLRILPLRHSTVRPAPLLKQPMMLLMILRVF